MNTPSTDTPNTKAPSAAQLPTNAPTGAASASAAPIVPVRIPRMLSGRVTSTKMQKTVTVEVSRRVKHERYGKYINRSKKYHAHVEEITVNEGDMVEIQECRPYSATKTWRVIRRLSGVGGR